MGKVARELKVFTNYTGKGEATGSSVPKIETAVTSVVDDANLLMNKDGVLGFALMVHPKKITEVMGEIDDNLSDLGGRVQSWRWDDDKDFDEYFG